MGKILYISPHPDDECLSMGMSIANHIWSGYDVYVALMTHGGSSGAKDTINGIYYCSWHDRYHASFEEGYYDISIDEFSDSRVEEFKFAAACLGVKPGNILIYDYKDGSLTKDDVKKVITEFLHENSGAFIKTTSYLDIHPDHKACGDALLELYKSGEVQDARFYVSPVQWDNTPGYFESNPSCNIFLEAGLSVYKRWNPSHKLYGIGYHSVSSIFDTVTNGLKSKYHVPGE